MAEFFCRSLPIRLEYHRTAKHDKQEAVRGKGSAGLAFVSAQAVRIRKRGMAAHARLVSPCFLSVRKRRQG